MMPSPLFRPCSVALPATLLAALLLAGCGQTGPLHLPEDAPAKENYLISKRRPKPAEAPAPPASPETAPAATPAEPQNAPSPSPPP